MSFPRQLKGPITEVEERRIVAALRDGISQRSVAERFGRSIRTVAAVGAKHGIAPKAKAG